MWCYSARYWRLPNMITGNTSAARPCLPGLRFLVWAAEYQRVRVPSPRPVHPEPAPGPRLRRAVLATIEPQKRLAPHVHVAMRGTVSRAELRQIIAATYHQVWWPSTDVVRFEGDRLPVWHEPARHQGPG